MEPKLLEEMMERAAKKAVAEFSIQHPCHLSETERGLVHALHEISSEEGANHGHWRLIIQWGVSVKDVTKTIQRYILWVILGLCGIAVLMVKHK